MVVTEAQALEDSHYYDGWFDDISAETDDPCSTYTNYIRLSRNELTTNNECMANKETHITGSMWIRISGLAGNAMATTVRSKQNNLITTATGCRNTDAYEVEL